jgi:hypothetical protein
VGIRGPSVGIALVILVMLLAFAISRMPRHEGRDHHLNLGPTVRRLSNRRYARHSGRGALLDPLQTAGRL